VDAATARTEIERRLLAANKNTATTPLYVAQAAILGELAVGHVGQDAANRPRLRRRSEDGDHRFVKARLDTDHMHAVLASDAALR
jgi:hypothetical protein